jgi:glycosyltransferase involved in cell wall biosynthesis
MSIVVTFIIPALNEERHISRCLQSIRRLSLPDEVDRIEIIVVDNQSTDRTADVSRREGAIVELIAPGHPSRARNAGARPAMGDWLAFVDADCELPVNWLTTCGSHLLQDEEVVAAAGVMGLPSAEATWVERAWFDLAHRANRHGAAAVRWLPTYNLLVRRQTFERVGGFDESLSTCEDCDLGYRMAAIGRQMVDARAEVVHSGESRSLRELFRREAWRTRGNFRLAWARPFDGGNWISLLFPPGVLAILAVALGGGLASFAIGSLTWPWFAVLLAMLVGVALLVARKSMSANVMSLARQTVVFLTYLSGRTAGLLWAFKRVER